MPTQTKGRYSLILVRQEGEDLEQVAFPLVDFATVHSVLWTLMRSESADTEAAHLVMRMWGKDQWCNPRIVAAARTAREMRKGKKRRPPTPSRQ